MGAGQDYVYGYSGRERERLADQADTLAELLHSDTSLGRKPRSTESEVTSNRARRDTAGDPQNLTRLLVSRANPGDIEGIVALHEPDAVLACGHGRVAAGTDAIRRFYTELLATGRVFDLGDQRPALIRGDLALTSTRLPNGTVTAEIARKQSDGTLLWVIDQPSIGV